MDDLTLFLGIGGSAVVAALVQVVKITIGISDTEWARWIPLSSIVLGILWNALVTVAVAGPLEWYIILLLGIFSGLAASGAYSGTRATLKV